MKSAIVLSGGGARGAYEAGVVSVIQANTDTIPVVGGTSTGSLVSTLIAIDEWDLMRLIYNGGVRTENIIRPLVLPKFLAGLANVFSDPAIWLGAATLFSKPAIYSIEPLMKIVDKHVDFQDVLDSDVNVYFTTTNFRNLHTKYFSNFDGESSADELRLGLFASVSEPVLMKYVVINGESYVDGGLTEFLPAMHAASAPNFSECDEVFFVDTNDPIDQLKPPKPPKQVLEKTFATLTKLVDVNCYMQAAFARMQFEATHPGIEIHNISPSQPLPIKNSLHFSPNEMKKAYALGCADARKYFKKIDR